jgi:hypothetical protein
MKQALNLPQVLSEAQAQVHADLLSVIDVQNWPDVLMRHCKGVSAYVLRWCMPRVVCILKPTGI